jgi:hypothetical protein
MTRSNLQVRWATVWRRDCRMRMPRKDIIGSEPQKWQGRQKVSSGFERNLRIE